MYKSLRYFQVSRPLQSLPSPAALGHQVEKSADYFSHGTDRSAEQHCIFHYTLRGSGRIRFKGQEMKVTAGSGFLCIINDPEMSYCYPPEGKDAWEFIWFGYRGGNSRALTRELLDRYGPVFTLSSNNATVQQWLRLGITGDLPVFVDAYEGARQVNELLFNLGRSAELGGRLLGYTLEERIAFFLEENEGSCNVNDLAAKLGVSREYLSRSFKTETGDTISAYLQRYKCTRACQLLANSNLKVGNVARHLGFSNSSNFGRLFKAQVGMTPEEFRAANAAHAVPVTWQVR